jgi:hypothetical protein
LKIGGFIITGQTSGDIDLDAITFAVRATFVRKGVDFVLITGRTSYWRFLDLVDRAVALSSWGVVGSARLTPTARRWRSFHGFFGTRFTLPGRT